jgi:hypothetical protein
MFNTSLFTEVLQIRGNRIASGPKRFLRQQSEFTPENAYKIGTIRTEGNHVFIRWHDQPDEFKNTFKPNSGCPNFMGGIVCRMETFKPGERITGTFAGTIGSSTVSQSVQLQLNPDGSYRLKRTGIVNAPSTGAVSEGQETGRYTLDESSLRLHPDGKAPEDYLVFPYPAAEPEGLWFGSRLLRGKMNRHESR